MNGRLHGRLSELRPVPRLADYRLSKPAEDKLDEILERSEEEFGELTRERYALLLTTAMVDIAEVPKRQGVKWVSCLRQRIGVYHIELSRDHVEDTAERIQEPRHSLVFRIAQDGIVDVLGFVHDRQLRRRAVRQIVKQNQVAL